LWLDLQGCELVPHPVTVAERCVRVAWLRPVPVMLAAPIPALPGRGAFRWLSAEPKYDGYRVLLLRHEDRCVVQSRRGTDLSGSFPDLVAAAVEQIPDETILDGEVVVGVDGRLDFAELQRRVASPARAVALARERPATFLAFDLLVLDEHDLRPEPLSQRRTQLTELMSTCRPPLQQVPFTLDHDQAVQWLRDYAAAHIGVEGLILKRVDEPYAAGVRRWSKLRHRDSAEVLVGAVTGTLQRPTRLILALPDPDTPGGLLVAGGTSTLTDAQAAEVAAFLRPPTEPHPWPTVLPAGRSGIWGGEPIQVTLVDPTLVVEVLADTAQAHGHWRHVVRYLRARPDLTAAELDPAQAG
jgi:ATP-dependent DNA ligase